MTRREKSYQTRRTKQGTIAAKFQSCRVVARRRGKKFALTRQYLEDVWERQQGLCALSGVPLGFIGSGWQSASVDRINPAKGYVKGNVQWVCWRANDAKSAMGNRQFIDFCATVTAKHFTMKRPENELH